jgi:hypothetical protein
MKDLTGHAFGNWHVQKKAAGTKRGYWDCECVCGVLRTVFGGNLTSERTMSCGHSKASSVAAQNTTHGHFCNGQQTRVYRIYRGMLSRCYNKNQKTYARYGAKGVTVCASWLGDKGFENFLRDMGEPPPGMSIERTDNTLGYTPENCVWATTLTQARNKTNVRLIDGVPKTVWAVRNGLSLSRLYKQAAAQDCDIFVLLQQHKEKQHAENVSR